MDNMATGFAFGMSGEEFGNIDFHAPMPGASESGGHPPPIMQGINQYPPFNPAGMPRESVFSQSSMMAPRSGMELPRFPMGAYGVGNDTLSPANFDSLMPPRHAYSSAGMSAFGELYPSHLSESDSRVGGEMTDNMADPMSSFGNVMSSPSSSSPSVIPSSMPVFPNTPSNMMHSAIGNPDINQKRDDGDNGRMKAGSSMQSPPHGYKSPIRSPPPLMQTCFPGPVPASRALQQQGGSESIPGSMVSAHSKSQSQAIRYKEERDFSGGPMDPVSTLVIGNEVTPMQRRRHSPRRANMLAQEVAAAAAAVLAVETKQAPMPPMLSAHESHLLGAIPHNMGYPPSMSMVGGMPAFSSSQSTIHASFPRTPSRRGRRPRMSSGEHISVYQGHFDQSMDSNAGISRKHSVVPFFKAGPLSMREPEMFDGTSRKLPLVTQATQTGQGICKEEVLPVTKPHLLKESKYADVDPTDGKGGFPLSSYSSPPHHQLFPRAMPVSRVMSEETHHKGFVEGEGYAKRGNSKTVVSPSFGESAARAVMTTSVGDSATVVTVAIMSRGQNMGAKTRLSSSLLSPRPSTSHDSGDDLKENMKIPMSDDPDPSNPDGSPLFGMQTRRSRRSGSSITMPTISSRGRTLRRRTDPDNISIEDDENFEMMMEDRKEKARAAEQERMEISIRIDDSQCVTYGDQKRWQCELCDKSYTTKHNLVMHMLDHNGIKPHLCLVCGKYFKQLSHLNTHMLTHDKVRPHICPSCGKGFTQISHLKRHQAVHQESKPYSCDECGRGFTFPSELRIHKERHISGRYIEHTCAECGEHTCAECGEEFPSGSLLRQHEVIHENRSNLSCNYCNRNFRYPSQLRDHIVIHSNSRPYMCTECGMDFMKEHHLRSHQFTHTGLRPYGCPVCGRAFNQRANMLRHMLIHKSERSYKCEYCDKSFTQPQTLKAHMVVHSDHKPYKCSICNKEFGRLHNLHGHMHMHNNSKPYICFCGSSFTLKGNLNRHKKVKHGLNESTEHMEEDAVHFLSSWSERAREERFGDEETLDDYDLNGINGHLEPVEGIDDVNVDGNDIDGSSLDLMDKSSSRKQRKSTPRKIPRRSAGGRKKNSESNGEDDMDDEGEDELEEEEATPPPDNTLQFQALTDEGQGSIPQSGPGRKHPHQINSDKEAETPSKRSRRERNPHYAAMANGDFVAGLSDSEKEEGGEQEGVDDDSEWLPGEGPRRNGKGAKLDSLIAEKFKHS
ncbi:hypothetical protein ACOMHN_061518 [Nucella lapillus]